MTPGFVKTPACSGTLLLHSPSPNVFAIPSYVGQLLPVAVKRSVYGFSSIMTRVAKTGAGSRLEARGPRARARAHGERCEQGQHGRFLHRPPAFPRPHFSAATQIETLSRNVLKLAALPPNLNGCAALPPGSVVTKSCDAVG